MNIQRKLDDPVVLEALKTIDSLKQIKEKHPKYVDEYLFIKTNHAKRLITTSKKYPMYGLFMPETTLFWHMKKDNLQSKITQNEDAKNYAYYFDSEDRLIMAERFSDGCLSKVYLYYYNNGCTEIIVFDVKDAKIDYIRRIEYVDGIAKRHSDYSCFGFDALTTHYFYEDKIVVNDKHFYANYVQDLTYEIRKQDDETSNHEAKNEMIKSDVKSDVKSEIKALILKSLKEIDDEGIYAFSLYVEDDGDETKPTVTFGYNTQKEYESSVEKAWDALEAKWNYAFWLQNELFVYGKEESSQTVQNWIEKNNLLDDDDVSDDETPKITKAFVNILVNVVKELHKEKVLTEKFGKELPILIHELEYYGQIAEQNVKANGKRLLGDFLEFCPLE